MKKWLSIVLVILILFSTLPSFVLATEIPEFDAVIDNDGEIIGSRVVFDDSIYSIIEDELHLTNKSGVDSVISNELVSWVLKKNNNIYWTEIDNNTTIIKERELSLGTTNSVLQLFVPVEAFDFNEEFLYYLYNGDVFRFNIQTTEEELVLSDKTMEGFYLGENGIVCGVEKIQIEPEYSGLVDLMKTDAPLPNSSGWLWPVKTWKHVYSPYNVHSGYLQGKRGGQHGGIDISPGREGDTIYAAKAGTIIKLENSCSHKHNRNDKCGGGFGNHIVINHHDGTYSIYAHMKQYSNVVSYGQRVERGTPLGQIGSSGSSGGFHLHFQIQTDLTYQNVCNVNPQNSAITSSNHNDPGYSNSDIRSGGTINYILDDSFYGGGKPTLKPEDTFVEIMLTSFPADNFKPQSFPLQGYISSNSPVTSISAVLKNTTTGETICSFNKYVYTEYYKVRGSDLDNSMKFGNIRTNGKYLLQITAKNEAGKTESIERYFTVNVNNSCTRPEINITSIENGQKATISCSDANALIHCTDNNGYEHTGKGSITLNLTVPGNHTLKAWTTRSGYDNSPINTQVISVSKVKIPEISNVVYDGKANNAFVTISGTSGSSIYYTTDGSTPSPNSYLYTGPIYITDSTLIKAINTKHGNVNSDIAEKNVLIEDPEKPTIRLKNTKAKVAQGKTATVEWNQTERAIGYAATLYYKGEEVETYNTSGTTASFVLNSTGQYEIGVKAIGINLPSLKGYSGESFVTVESMAPVTITFIDKIDRNRQVTDEVLSEVQQRINEHDGENAELIEGNIISVQTIDYDTKPAKPVTPSKKGFTFSGWSGELFETATEDKTVYANFEINYYTVDFFDTAFDTPQQLGHTQEVMYTDSADEPTDYSTPEGYYLSGWSVDNTKSSGFDYTYVDGNIVLNTVYNWENTELPIHVEITELERNDESYKVSINYKNNPVEETRGRMVVALYTSEGRNVYTQISETDLKIGEMTEWTSYGTVTLLYTGKIAYAKAFVVAVDGDKTGGALSEAAVYDNITYEDNSNFWTEWSDWQDEPVESSENVQVITRTVYRYQDKTEATSTTTKNLGSEWTYYNTTSWNTGWKSNGTNSIGAFENESQKREVSSSWVPATYKTQYRYGRWTNGSNVHFCPQLGRSNYGGSWYQQHSSWSDSSSPIRTDKPEWYCNNTLGHSHINPNRKSGNVDYWYYYRVNNNTYYWQETRSVQTGGGYTTYSYRDTYYTHYFYKWGDWSEWSDSEVTPSGSRNVEEKTQYQYRTVSDVDMESEEPTLYTYQKTLELSNVQEDLSGELATVMIYKKTNTDPTQEQIEYIDQITIGEGNIVEINANTKEMLDYSKTGDFIVALALEGGKELINIDYIEAPAPVYTVNFYVDGQLFETVYVEEEKSVDVNEIGIPEIEGKVFSKWDKSVVDINRNLDVNAVFEQETYQIVFVDHENKTVQTEEFSCGDALIVPAVAMIDGKTFKGWDKVVDNEEYIVEKSDVITAQWENVSYQVKFCDFDGLIISEQTVEYGKSAELPQAIVKDGVTYQWDLTGYTWWHVTQDMEVYPYIPQTYTIPAPMSSTPQIEGAGTFLTELSTNSSEHAVYYTLNYSITEDEVRSFVDNIMLFEKDMDDVTEDNIPIGMMSAELETESDENYSISAEDFITQYTEPIMVSSGSVLYAFAVDSEGNISPVSIFNYECDLDKEDPGSVPNEYIPGETMAQIVMPTVVANHGETVTIPVTIKNNPGLTNLGIVLGYNAEELTLLKVENGDVFADRNFSYETREDGSCKFIWTSSSTNDTDGVLMNLTFKVADFASKEKYLLDLNVESSLNVDEETYLITVPGAITEDTTVLGDVNGDGEIDFADGIRILKHDVGLIDLAGDALITGDVNGDGEVDFADAILVLKFDVGLISSFKK